ncbi:MAG TPA: glycoside hydrolase family 27 protein [Polyangiaceae bacterium]
MRSSNFRRYPPSQSLLVGAAILLGSLMSLNQAAALDNGLAKTPPMGWNSWNAFAGTIDETKIKQIADIMVSSGMKDAGYVYLNLDDNWMANPARDSSGNLRGDPTRFPNGMKALGDYIHGKGLKFGIYGDRGTMTCMNVPQSGSYQHEQADAKTFASFGVDYFKNDNCNPVGNIQTDYQNMQKALASSGRDIVYSVCHPNGYSDWMQSTGNLWRISGDIVDKWDNGTNFYKGIINLIDANASLASHAKPGAWNDPDMLEIGNTGCTTEEYRTQMSMWSIMAAPLLAGNDIRSMSQTTKDILLNTEVIAVDQDAAGIQGTRIKATNGLEVWCKPLGSANGTTKAVALLNRNASASNITVNFTDIGLSGSASVRDLWAKADKGSFTDSFSMSVPSHGTGMLRITVGGGAGGSGSTGGTSGTATGVGGTSAQGGATSSGGSGTKSSGGTSASAGASSTGGSKSTGGANPSGGSSASAGGSSSAGGSKSTGGANPSGGGYGTGGTSGTGGASTGGTTNASGGASTGGVANNSNGGTTNSVATGGSQAGLQPGVGGGTASDVGTIARDAGSGESSGCGCRVASSNSRPGLSSTLVVLGLALWQLRRRRLGETRRR